MLDKIESHPVQQILVIEIDKFIMRFLIVFFCRLENHTATVLWEICCHLVTSQSELEVNNYITINLTKG